MVALCPHTRYDVPITIEAMINNDSGILSLNLYPRDLDQMTPNPFDTMQLVISNRPSIASSSSKTSNVMEVKGKAMLGLVNQCTCIGIYSHEAMNL